MPRVARKPLIVTTEPDERAATERIERHQTRKPASPPSSSRAGRGEAAMARVALFGNPNTGKTTLFNRLCGLRAKTANFPGITTEARVGQCPADAECPTPLEVVDLPGIYRLNLQLPEAAVCRQVLAGEGLYRKPDAVLVVVDATNLARNLALVGELLASGLPVVVALNMIDLAQRRGLTIDAAELGRRLGCPVIPIVARKGWGLADLRRAIATSVETKVRDEAARLNVPDALSRGALEVWADETAVASVGGADAVGGASDTFTERLDQAFTHPILGLLIFAGVMAGLFMVIFKMAEIPMTIIENLFGAAAEWTAATLPDGAINDLVSQGIVAGVGSVVVFLPQICLLFLLISLLEDTGYLARAAFVMDRLMCRFGLPGQAFVPLLSSHACALPGIMSAKLIPDRQDRLATILVAPFMSCSARVPVYVLLTGLLFHDRPWLAGLAFLGCYLLGAAVAMLSAWLARRTILRGRSRPMMLELPSYKVPSLRTALLTTYDRGMVFLRNAGTVILAISVVLWWLGAYPVVDSPAEAVALREQAAAVESIDPAAAEALSSEADTIESSHAKAHSFAGRLGRFAQPVFAPLGYDWQLTVGVLSSFAAREVFVSTMAVLIAGQDEADATADAGLFDRIRNAKRDDLATPVFTPATCASLLVFFVLAMQCLPTLAVTRRETGSWKWAGLQLGYMSLVAYGFAFVTYQGLTLLGVA